MDVTANRCGWRMHVAEPVGRGDCKPWSPERTGGTLGPWMREVTRGCGSKRGARRSRRRWLLQHVAGRTRSGATVFMFIAVYALGRHAGRSGVMMCVVLPASSKLPIIELPILFNWYCKVSGYCKVLWRRYCKVLVLSPLPLSSEAPQRSML